MSRMPRIVLNVCSSRQNYHPAPATIEKIDSAKNGQMSMWMHVACGVWTCLDMYGAIHGNMGHPGARSSHYRLFCSE